MTRVALRSVRTHIGQFLLTVLAVVLGVTFLSGTLALRGVLSDTFSALTSSTMTADLYVTGQPIRGQSNNDGSIMTERIDASLAETIAGVDGVESAHPYSSAPATLVGADDPDFGRHAVEHEVGRVADAQTRALERVRLQDDLVAAGRRGARDYRSAGLTGVEGQDHGRSAGGGHRRVVGPDESGGRHDRGHRPDLVHGGDRGGLRECRGCGRRP